MCTEDKVLIAYCLLYMNSMSCLKCNEPHNATVHGNPDSLHQGDISVRYLCPTCFAAPSRASSISTVFLAATPRSSWVDFLPYVSQMDRIILISILCIVAVGWNMHQRNVSMPVFGSRLCVLLPLDGTHISRPVLNTHMLVDICMYKITCTSVCVRACVHVYELVLYVHSENVAPNLEISYVFE